MDSRLKRWEKEGFSPLYEEIFEEYKATVSVGSGVFYDRFDGDECLEDVLVRAGKYIKALKDWKNDLSGENGNSSTNG